MAAIWSQYLCLLPRDRRRYIPEIGVSSMSHFRWLTCWFSHEWSHHCEGFKTQIISLLIPASTRSEFENFSFTFYIILETLHPHKYHRGISRCLSAVASPNSILSKILFYSGDAIEALLLWTWLKFSTNFRTLWMKNKHRERRVFKCVSSAINGAHSPGFLGFLLPVQPLLRLMIYDSQ